MFVSGSLCVLIRQVPVVSKKNYVWVSVLIRQVPVVSNVFFMSGSLCVKKMDACG